MYPFGERFGDTKAEMCRAALGGLRSFETDEQRGSWPSRRVAQTAVEFMACARGNLWRVVAVKLGGDVVTIHRVECVASPVHEGPHIAIAFCGVEERFIWPLEIPTMAMEPGKANCEACAAKMAAVSRAEWAAVKP